MDKTLRPRVQSVLSSLGIANRFTLRTVDFTDLARATVTVVTIKQWSPSPLAAQVKDAIQSIATKDRLLVDFE